MDVDDVVCDLDVGRLVAFVEDHEEQIETTHNRRAHRDILTQRLSPVIPTANRVGRREDGRTRIERRVDASLRNRDSLLFHGFVNGDLVGDVHLVELVDGANTVIREHECTSLDGKLARLFILDHCRRETSRRARLAGRIDRTREERADVLEELGLGRAGVADDANVDVATNVHALLRRLVHSTHELQQQTLLDELVTVHRRRDTLNKVGVDVLVVHHRLEFLHLGRRERTDNLLPLCHLIARFVISTNIRSTRLSRMRFNDHARQERSLVLQIAHTKTLEAGDTTCTCTRATRALRLAHHLRIDTRQTELADIRNDDERARENTLVASFCALDEFATQDDIERAWHRSCRDLVGVLLDTHALPVGELGTVADELPRAVVTAHRLRARVWLEEACQLQFMQ